MDANPNQEKEEGMNGFHAPLDPDCPEVREHNAPFAVLLGGRAVTILGTVGDTGPCEHGPPEPIYSVRMPGGMTVRVEASELEYIQEDPMTTYSGCGDEIQADFERRHRARCERCQEYGAANIEVA